MGSFLKEFIRELRNPEQASSFAPLLVVISVFILVSAGVIFIILRMLRAHTSGPEATEEKDGTLVYLNPAAKFRNFLRRRILSSTDEQYRVLLAELDTLRLQNAKLAKENAQLRDLHATSLNRQTELKEQLTDFEKSIDEATKAREAAINQRIKTQERLEEVETQLKDIMSELDGIYKQNAKSLENANERRIKAQKRTDEIEHQLSDFLNELERTYRSNSGISDMAKFGAKLGSLFQKEGESPKEPVVVAPPPPPPQSTVAEILQSQRLISDQADEIEKLRNVLRMAKEQIMFLSKQLQAPKPIPATRPPEVQAK